MRLDPQTFPRMNPFIRIPCRRAAGQIEGGQRPIPFWIRLALVACLVGGGFIAIPLRAVDDLTISSTTTYSGTSTVQADNSITTSATVTVGGSANVTYNAGAHVSLGSGFSVASGGLFQVNIGQSLPYLAGFESSEGFSTGSVNGQRGWSLVQGSASVSSADASAGSNSLTLSSGGTAAIVQQGFLVSSSPSVIFIDLYAKPVAASAAANSSIIQTESAQIGFQLSGGQGEVYVFDGVGSNTWDATGVFFPINGSNQASSWLRLTIRADYTNKKWDLYVNGVLADYDLAFLSNSETFFRKLALNGVTSATTYIDAIAAQETNPLFTDVDKDGMPDAWETAHGLNPAVDDRNSDHDGDGRTNIEEYFAGTDPNNADVTNPTATSSLSVTGTTTTTIALGWTAGTDSGAGTPGVAGYNVYRNGVKLNSSLVTTLTYTDTGLSASSSYTYTVKTVDLAGNLSSAASVLATTAATGGFEVFIPLP